MNLAFLHLHFHLFLPFFASKMLHIFKELILYQTLSYFQINHYQVSFDSTHRYLNYYFHLLCKESFPQTQTILLDPPLNFIILLL